MSKQLLNLLILFLSFTSVFAESSFKPDFYVEKNVAYIHNNESVFKIDLIKNEQIWQYTPASLANKDAGKCQTHSLIDLIILLDNELMVFTQNREMHFIDINTGKLNQSVYLDMNIFEGPVYYEGMLYFTASGWNIVCFDPNTRAEKWRYHAKGLPLTLTYGNSRIYYSDDSGNMTALDAKSGEQEWENISDHYITYKPLLWQDRIFYGMKDGRIVKANEGNGARMWTTEPTAIGEEKGIMFAWKESIAFKGNKKDGIYVCEVKNLKGSWLFPGKDIDQKLIVQKDSMLYYIAEGNIKCSDMEKGYIYIDKPLAQLPRSTPVVDDYYYYYQTEGSDNLHIFDLESQKNTSEITVPASECLTEYPPVPRSFLQEVASYLSYPEDVLKEGVKWEVIISCLFDENGKIIDKFINQSPDERLAQEVMQALEQELSAIESSGTKQWLNVRIPFKY